MLVVKRGSSFWGIGRRFDQHIELAKNVLANMGAREEQAFHVFDVSHMWGRGGRCAAVGRQRSSTGATPDLEPMQGSID